MRVTIDGEVFAIARRADGTVDHDWLCGPNPGYGFSVSPIVSRPTPDDHLVEIRAFLLEIDPRTGIHRDDKDAAEVDNRHGSGTGLALIHRCE